MVPIISVVGVSKTNRTSLVEKLVAELGKRDYRVATVKRDAHCYDLDTPGKASWRHSQAGAQTVIVSSSARITMFKQVEKEWTLDELTGKFFFDVDIVITDGYTDENKPKIKVLAAKAEDDIQIPESNLVSVVAVNSDVLTEQDKIPKFSLEEIDKLADLIEARFLKEEL